MDFIKRCGNQCRSGWGRLVDIPCGRGFAIFASIIIGIIIVIIIVVWVIVQGGYRRDAIDDLAGYRTVYRVTIQLKRSEKEVEV